MSWFVKGLAVLAVISAAGLLTILIRRARGQAAGLIRPLLGGVLCLDGMGLVVIIAARLSATAGSSSFSSLPAAALSMVADTAIFVLKFGWLLAFLTFLRRFALPLGERLFRRLIAAVMLPVVLLVAGGWIEFLLASRRGLFDNLQYVSDYLVFFSMIGAGLYLRSRTAVLVSREAAKAVIFLGGLVAPVFLVLGLWWIAGDSVSRLAPALEAAFIPLMFLVFNGGLAFWAIRFSGVLASRDIMRFVPRRIPESFLSRWGISRREGEIIELVGQGLSNQDIADRLFISLFTVKKHLNNVFQKTGVGNRVQLVRLCSEAKPVRACEAGTEGSGGP